jgi:hypothetical protein
VPKKTESRRGVPAPATKKPGRKYEPPKLVKFEKLERLIVSGE